ncbi:Hypothetical predicted protein [Octopus vulgaris]|uniref:Uncharacterized protein n=3 Tax=Octopus TaxID=6643 RepID=A0AA36FFP4_OCTVU|nr:uncharacterized protein LOC115219548 isoform X1 [Octopus sinensis]CAI9732833.1 Hypothetical predicted protein [Octopus vulgaris]
MASADVSFPSYLFYGCCGENTMIDFSKVELFPDFFFPDSQIRWSDTKLWILLCIILVILPLWLMVCTIFLKKKLKNSHQGDLIYALATAVLLVPSFVGFLKLIADQPHWSFLQSNMFLLTGYFFILIGVCHIHHGIKSLEISHILKDPSSKTATKTSPGFPTCASLLSIESTLFLGNSLLYLGASLIYASQAGVLVTLFLGFSYIEIMHIRKYLELKNF